MCLVEMVRRVLCEDKTHGTGKRVLREDKTHSTGLILSDPHIIVLNKP